MKSNKVITLFLIITVFTLVISFEDVYADKTIEVEIKYTNGDRVDFNDIQLIVYQNYDTSPILEKKIESNPHIISVPENNRYKIEVYVNGMYAGVEYIQLDNNPKKLNINIPLSGGIQFEIYYKNGQIPIKDATVILKSQNNLELRKGVTNDQGETIRYWVQSTSLQNEHYVVDVYLDDLFLTSSTVKVHQGVATNKKITTNIPETIEELISINLYDGSNKITSKDGEYKVTLEDVNDNEIDTANVNFRGDAHFSSLKSGTYTVKITPDNIEESNLWPQNKIHIVGDVNNFNIFKNSQDFVNQENPFLSCNCISFRLDDVQDYWLADTQIQLIGLFAEKNIPISVGIIGSLFGSDENLISVLTENIDSENIEIVNHSWNNEPLTNFGEVTQDEYITKTNEKILDVLGVTPTALIPPQNLYDENTVKTLKKNGFTHLISHVKENSDTNIEDNSFYIVPATTETGILLDSIQWKIQEKDHIYEMIKTSLSQKGYAIVMIHPQEFSLNDQGEYDIPNTKYIGELDKLLDEISQLDSKIVKISNVKPHEEIIEKTQESQEVNPNTIEEPPIIQETEIESCNCVSFRLEDVQDYWLNDVQIKIMEIFIENETPLTIGIIADAFGNDPKITEFVRQNIENEKGNLQVATKGIGLTSFTNYDKNEQNKNLKESIDLIESNLNVKPHVFIPPGNKFNSDTMEILENNGITHISSSLTNGDSPPFEFKGEKVYRFPQVTSTSDYNTAKNIFEGVPNHQTFSESIQGIDNYGFSVISIAPQAFSMIENSTYTNAVNQKQIEELEKLIEEFNEKGYKIVSIDEINSNLIVKVPSWIKNNAGWWAEGAIDDNSFVQGIQFLIKEGIMSISS
jgi:peptidoglycan/xylan/chitin deacetylase (PgdA/CDA1 family)